MNRPIPNILLPAGLLLTMAALAACGGDMSGHDMSSHDMTSPGMTSPGTGPSASSSMTGHDMPGMGHDGGSPGGTAGMDGMNDMPGMGGDGLAASVSGYTLAVTQEPMGDMAMPITVTISKAGKPVTGFAPEQTKLMHLYLIRSDLTGFQHLHPTMDPAGTWSSPSVRVPPGIYRLYTQVVPAGLSEPIVLSQPITVAGPGADKTQPAPKPDTGGTGTGAAIGTADGYTVTVHGNPRAGTATELELTITRAGKPVTDLQPYLDTYAHVTAIHAGDLAFAHLHPEQPANSGASPTQLALHADLPRPGVYRLFVQFQTDTTLHTVPVTLTAN